MPKFLQDTPTEEDILWWTHTKLTDSLKKIIESLNQNKSIKNIIWLFWDWWSWKSSIIKQLDKEKNYTVFEFDSWSHKDEFLKRAFLIELTKSLSFHDKNLNQIWYINEKYKNINSIDFLSKKNIIKTLDVKPKTNYHWLGFLWLLVFF